MFGQLIFVFPSVISVIYFAKNFNHAPSSDRYKWERSSSGASQPSSEGEKRWRRRRNRRARPRQRPRPHGQIGRQKSGRAQGGGEDRGPEGPGRESEKGRGQKNHRAREGRPVKKAAAPKKAGAVKKAAAPKLNEKQIEILKKVHGAGESGYEVNKTELRTIEALKTRNFVKAGAKDKATGKVRYTVTKAGLKHVMPAGAAPAKAPKA